MAPAKNRLRIFGAFSALLTTAIAVGCTGFFVNPTLTSLAIGPSTSTIDTGGTDNTVQLRAVGTNNDGSTATNPSVTWAISGTPTSGTGVVATISSSGLVTSSQIGTASVTATSTVVPSVSASATVTVVPGNVTSISVTPSSQGVTSTETFNLLAEDQAGDDISGSVTWTFEVQGTTTIESGLSEGTETATGAGVPFTIGTLSPTPVPVNLSAYATLTVNGTTITSNVVTIDITQ